MIQVTDVHKRYGSYHAVKGATVTLHKERITALIGPNGAGKSTLLSMISRLIPMDSGQVHIDGREVREWKSDELAQKMGTLRQSNHLNLRLTVEELVSFGRFPYSRGRLTVEDREHIDRALRYMNLQELRHKYLDQLSGGERQRAFIAMVIAQDTDYILLDEPLNNLDMKHSVQIMQVLRRLVGELGKTIVLVVHDINCASCYSDDIVAMKDGRVVQAGPARDIIDPHILREVYDLDIRIQEIQRQRICVYFQ